MPRSISPACLPSTNTPWDASLTNRDGSTVLCPLQQVPPPARASMVQRGAGPRAGAVAHGCCQLLLCMLGQRGWVGSKQTEMAPGSKLVPGITHISPSTQDAASLAASFLTAITSPAHAPSLLTDLIWAAQRNRLL